jgi:predicted MPP superfamily phosphohydrolase
MIIRIAIVLAILAGALVYVGRRLIIHSPLQRRGRRVASAVYTTWFVSIVALTILSMSFASASGAASWYTYVSLGFLSFLFFLLLIRDIVALAGRLVARLRARGHRSDAVDEGRREHLLRITNAGVIGASAILTSYGLYEARRRPGIVEIDVPIERLPRALDGFRIVQITDIHAGLTVGRDWVETIVAEVSALAPDLIAFTGDVVDGSVAHLADVVRPFSELRAPHGMFFVTGNHEYYSGAVEWVRQMERFGYDVLMNEHRIVERDGARFVVGGVTDFTAGEFVKSHASDPARAFRGAPPELARVFMAHQPKTLRQTDGVDFDLMLSGHTHGGQFFPWNLLTALDQPYLSGLHRPQGKWIYVSKGTGYWGPPVRLGARSEITVVRLRYGRRMATCGIPSSSYGSPTTSNPSP